MLDIPPPPTRKGSTQPAPQTQQFQPAGNPLGHDRRPSEPQTQQSQPPTSAQHYLLSSSPPTPSHEAPLQQQHQVHQGQVVNASGSVGGSNMGGAQANPTPNVSSNHGVSARNGSHPPPSFSSAHLPPRLRPLSELGSEATVDDVMVIPKSTEREEFSEIGGGGWKLVSRVVGGGSPKESSKEKDRIKMMRRRTTIDRTG